MKLFVIYDLKSKTYDRPLFFKTVNDGIRAFEMALNDKDSVLSKYKSDFEMLLLADLDLETLEMRSVEKTVVCAGRDYEIEDKDAKKS